MKGLSTVSAVLATGVSLLQQASAIQTISLKGNAFFAGNSRFYIRGIDYQPGGSSQLVDPLADANTCQRDIKYFSDLGINTIRVYSVDNSANHDTCMNALSSAGIYLILDVNTPLYSLNRMDPKTSYNDVYLQNIFATMDMFSKYDNTLAFFSGNEVINETAESTQCAPYIKAVTRDMKQYQGNRQQRRIPIGYSAADVSSNRYETAEYMNCGTDDERSDFFAFNDYSWCDPSSFQTSGWDQKVQLFSNYSLPIFLSEYGCNTNTRDFGEVTALYSSQMTPVYSGGLVYEYSQEQSNYGLVQISGGNVQTLSDYTALKKAFANTPAPSGDGGYRSNSGGASPCPAKSKTWDVSGDSLPALPAPAQKYMTQGAGAGPGLKGNNGAGSQNAGTQSSGTASAGSGQPSTTATTGGSSSSSSKSAAPLRIPDATWGPFLTIFAAMGLSLLGAMLL